VVADVKQRIASAELSRVGEHRQDVWEKGWDENLQAFTRSGYDIDSLTPRFIKTGPIVRLDQNYVRRIDPRFEFLFHDVVRRWLFLTYLPGVARVFEFGCGSAYNLVALSELFPDVPLFGLDWAESAVSLASSIGRERGVKIVGRQFDFFHPDATVDLGPADAAVTIHALEQIGDRHELFLQFLLEKRPRICVHLEPIVEFYDPDNETDRLAFEYHTTRGYLSGFLPRLRALESAGRIEMIDARRLRFGSLYHEAYSIVVWRPTGIR
jgi:SAM-dependent methyltransferase